MSPVHTLPFSEIKTDPLPTGRNASNSCSILSELRRVFKIRVLRDEVEMFAANAADSKKQAPPHRTTKSSTSVAEVPHADNSPVNFALLTRMSFGTLLPWYSSVAPGPKRVELTIELKNKICSLVPRSDEVGEASGVVVLRESWFALAIAGRDDTCQAIV